MGARPGSTTTKPKGRATRKLNRSEQQAMRIRAAANAAARAAAADDVPAAGAQPIRTGEGVQRPPTRMARARVATHGTVLSREQEMAFVRADLRRLLWIAGIILVGMLVLLAVLPA